MSTGVRIALGLVILSILGFFGYKFYSQYKLKQTGRTDPDSAADESLTSFPSFHPYGDGKYVETSNPYFNVPRTLNLKGNEIVLSSDYVNDGIPTDRLGSLQDPRHRKIFINGVYRGNNYHSAYNKDGVLFIRSRATNDFPLGEMWETKDGFNWFKIAARPFKSRIIQE